jgi:hypothetical protein
MQASAFNNPLFAQGLAGLVQGFIGDPSATAAAEEAASRALLNNQTAQFRDAIGDTGLSGDLSAMMIRALQAGPEYAGHAPTIGRAALGMTQAGFGNLQPQGLAGLVGQAMTPQPQQAPAPQAAPQAAPQPAAPPAVAPAATPQPAALPLLTPDQPLADVMVQLQIMNAAREAIAQGAQPQDVAARLAAIGLDPSAL